MAGGKNFKEGPESLAAAAADIYNPASGTFSLIRHIHIANTDSSARTVSLYVGATGGSANGTELVEGKSIAANDVLDLYFPAGLRLISTDFLSGLASAATVVVITITGELYVV